MKYIQSLTGLFLLTVMLFSQENSITHINSVEGGSEYQLSPLIKRSGDTLIIWDAWFVTGELLTKESISIKKDTLHLDYNLVSHNTNVEMYIPEIWKHTFLLPHTIDSIVIAYGTAHSAWGREGIAQLSDLSDTSLYRNGSSPYTQTLHLSNITALSDGMSVSSHNISYQRNGSLLQYPFQCEAIQLFNLEGKEVIRNSQTNRLNLAGISSGIYVAVIQRKNYTYSHRLTLR